jgi:hypothetical protein
VVTYFYCNRFFFGAPLGSPFPPRRGGNSLAFWYQ